MKKMFMILFLILSIALISACSKVDDGLIDEKEPGSSLNQEEKPERPGDEEKEEDEGKKDQDHDLPIYEKKIAYKDDLYGFSLEIPSSWEGKYIIERETWIDDINESVSFNYKEENIFNNIFTIVIMNESLSEDEWEELFLIYIQEHNGKTFSYLNIMEPTEELLEEENKSKLETVTQMVESVPQIIESFRIE